MTRKNITYHCMQQ